VPESSRDPLYAFDAERIQAPVDATYETVIKETRRNESEFVWGDNIASVEKLGVVRARAGVGRSTFYPWYPRYREEGDAGLEARAPATRRHWNRIPERERQRVVEAALADPEPSPRDLAWQTTDRTGHFISESSVYRILKAHDLIASPAFVLRRAADHFQPPTTRPNELWQTDFTYLRVVDWGWYYLSTVLDDYSRYILPWTLSTTMKTSDVTETLDLVRAAAGGDQERVVHRPRLLSDNGPCYVSGELATYLGRHDLTRTRGAPYHPMTQSKIERWHRSMKNVVKLDPTTVSGSWSARLAASWSTTTIAAITSHSTR